ncbi:MAG: hypothetical protein ACXWCQ_32465 [Burkholderiales bacterium]
MKIHTLSAALGIPVLAAPAFAQTPPTAQDAKKDMNAQKKDPLMMQESAPADWTMIKGHDKGFLTMDEAAPNSWLAANLKPCDKNSDGKVTEAEYTACQKSATR